MKPRQDLQKTVHLVLRIAPKVRVRSRVVDVVAEHNRTVARQGYVALGKFGARLGPNVHHILGQHVSRHDQPRIYLVHKSAADFVAVSAIIDALTPKPLPLEYRDGIPDYYAHMDPPPSDWFILREPLLPTPLSNLELVSSGRNACLVMAECRTASMLVREGV